uniref:TOG domain-containing protein n=1 Tax=Parascaris univalens TaxID=6257 RepID=A0A915AXM8_PARUN
MSWLGELIEKNSSDPRQRLELGQQILAQLQTSRLPSDSTLLNDFCDLIVQWLSASNFKVALLAVEIIDVGIEVSGDVLSPYLVDRTSTLVERLGDSKQSVREAAIQLITTMANTPHCSPQIVLEKISPGLVHRQWLVRIGVMQVIRNILEQHKFEVDVQINRVIPTLCKLMGDPNSEVREAAANALVNIFCQLGEPVPNSIHKRQLIPESKFQMLMARYNEAQQCGGLAPATPSTSQRTARPLRRPVIPQKPRFTPQPIRLRRDPWEREQEEAGDMFKKPGAPSFAGRVMQTTRRAPLGEVANSPTTPSFTRASSVPAHKRPPVAVTAKNTGKAGGVSDEAFQQAFVQVPKCDIFSARELKDKVTAACATLEDVNVDWDRRVAALKTLRAIVIGGGLDFSNFSEELKEMEKALLLSTKDLRSQVCREACVTIAFYCERLENKMANTVLILMPTLINLLQNSAKVMATSSHLALQYAIKYVRSEKLLPHLQTAMTSKSREIRRASASLLLMALTLWEGRFVEKNMPVFLDCIKMSLSDADPETRSTGRNLYVQLDQDYKQQADILYKSLDPSKQRQLSGYVSQSSSSQSIISEKDSLPMSQRSSYALHKASPAYYSGRSTSDIDPMAARRATHANKWGGPLHQVNGTSNSMSLRTPTSQRLVSVSQRVVSGARRSSGTSTGSVVRSQPGSRSTSPNTRHQQSRLQPRTNIVGSGRMRNQTEDLEDGASASTDSLRFETAELTNALACCASTLVPDRKEGLKALFTVISSDRQISAIDLRKIVERLNVLIGEGSHKLLQSLCDVMVALVRRYNSELTDWLNHLIPKLVTKHANDVLSSNQEKFRTMMDAVRQYFNPDKQLHAVCKFIQDPIRNNVSYKVKYGLLMYLHELMSGMDSAPSMNQSEVRQAVNKIFQWVDDPKNAGLLQISEKVVCDMFHLNASDFTSMMATFPNELKDRLQAIIRRNSFATPKANGYSSNDAHAGILETTAQINEFVDSRTAMQTSPLRSPASLGNGSYRGSQENSFRRSSREDPNGSLSGYILDPEGLANDVEQQEELITKIGEELSLHNQRSAERIRAMAVLSQVTRDNLFSLWDKHFRMILLLLMETLKDVDPDVRRMALKLLKEICYSQASRVNLFAEMTLMRVLDACTDDSKLVVSAAEDCGNVLATHVSSATCRKVLIAVIRSDAEEQKVHTAIKMLTKVIESLSAPELELVLDELAPPIVETYNYESSSIRKESVVCLVAMIRIVGEGMMAPYLAKLNKGKQKLIDVYLQRMRDRSSPY